MSSKTIAHVCLYLCYKWIKVIPDLFAFFVILGVVLFFLSGFPCLSLSGALLPSLVSQRLYCAAVVVLCYIFPRAICSIALSISCASGAIAYYRPGSWLGRIGNSYYTSALPTR